MKKEDIKNEKMYMHTHSGDVVTGKEWLETISDQEEILKTFSDQEEVSEDLPLVEVVKDAGNWVEA